VHLFLADPDTAPFLADELRRAAPEAVQREIEGLGIAADVKLEGLLLAFARQTLPAAAEIHAASINAWADRIIDASAGIFPDDQPWRLHLWPQYGEGKAGLHRCELIQSSLVERLLPGVTAADLVQLNQWAHGIDLPIGALNALRRRFSALKDGRLAARLAGRPAQAFVLSDVPDDDPAVVGSAKRDE
jgi:hypothetical protein